MSAKVLLTHPGTQHARHLARQLLKNGLLYKFHTGIAFGHDSWQKFVIDKLPLSVKNKVSNRIINGIPANLIHTHIIDEIKALNAIRKGGRAEDVFFKRNNDFQSSIPDEDILNSDAVIGFDTSSWLLAQRCKKLNRPFILDVSIAHPYEKLAVFEKIVEQYPEWSFAIEQKSQQLIDLELMEFELADKIVVASTFSKNSLVKHGVAEEKIYVNPYGTDLDAFTPKQKQNKLVHFVFVGLADARKGIPVLLDAWRKVKPGAAILTLIGPIKKEIEELIKRDVPNITIRGRVPYSELPGVLSEHDVLVFPSYFEGFALVIPESMASGLTVITTPATCAPDIIDDDINGFIVPCGDVEMFAAKMQILIEHRSKLKAMQNAAAVKAKGFTWDAYGTRWENIITNN